MATKNNETSLVHLILTIMHIQVTSIGAHPVTDL